jgi:hypothetical protein
MRYSLFHSHKAFLCLVTPLSHMPYIRSSTPLTRIPSHSHSHADADRRRTNCCMNAPKHASAACMTPFASRTSTRDRVTTYRTAEPTHGSPTTAYVNERCQGMRRSTERHSLWSTYSVDGCCTRFAMLQTCERMVADDVPDAVCMSMVLQCVLSLGDEWYV